MPDSVLERLPSTEYSRVHVYSALVKLEPTDDARLTVGSTHE
jgi:hypothetical protein